MYFLIWLATLTSPLLLCKKKQLQKFLESRIGKLENVLVENNGIGRSEHFAEVKIDGLLGEIRQLKVNNLHQNKLSA